MESLRGIPELVALRHGEDAGHFPGNHEYVAVMDFADFAAARRYVASELHRSFVAEHASRVADARVVVQHDWATGAVSGLHHVKLPVTDVERSRDWYCTAFDFRPELEFREEAGWWASRCATRSATSCSRCGRTRPGPPRSP